MSDKSKEYIIHKNSLHYKLWCWTFCNMIWQKWIPTKRSKCQYWQRLFWIGMITLLLHILFVPLRLIFYSFLYRIVKVVFKNDIVAGIVVWLIALLCIFISGTGVFLPWFLGFMIQLIGLLIGVIVFCAWFFDESRAGEIIKEAGYDFICVPIGLAIKWTFICIFKWILWGTLKFFIFQLPFWGLQVIGRFYTPKEKLRDEKYKLNGGRNQIMIQLLFWLGFLGFPIIAFFLGGSGYLPPLPFIGNATWGWAILFLAIDVLLLLISWVVVHYDNKRFERELLYARQPELRPVEKPSITVRSIEKLDKYRQRNWDPFFDWLKSVKENLCPPIKFVD
jgi:hypothetical protein